MTKFDSLFGQLLELTPQVIASNRELSEEIRQLRILLKPEIENTTTALRMKSFLSQLEASASKAAREGK